MRRINVVGTSCSGKTTLATTLARRLDLPLVELDSLFWGPNWTPVGDDRFRAGLSRALEGPAWVADGGYHAVRDITWARADTVVWLDYPMRIVLHRWVRRTLRRLRDRREIWPGTGNRESIGRSMGRDSLLWWIIRTHRARRRRMGERLAGRPDLLVVRLRTPQEADRWLSGVSPR